MNHLDKMMGAATVTVTALALALALVLETDLMGTNAGRNCSHNGPCSGHSKHLRGNPRLRHSQVLRNNTSHHPGLEPVSAEGSVKGLEWELVTVLALDCRLDTNAGRNWIHNGPDFDHNMHHRGSRHLHRIQEPQNNTCLHQG